MPWTLKTCPKYSAKYPLSFRFYMRPSRYVNGHVYIVYMLDALTGQSNGRQRCWVYRLRNFKGCIAPRGILDTSPCDLPSLMVCLTHQSCDCFLDSHTQVVPLRHVFNTFSPGAIYQRSGCRYRILLQSKANHVLKIRSWDQDRSSDKIQNFVTLPSLKKLTI